MESKNEDNSKIKRKGILNKIFGGDAFKDERITQHSGLFFLVLFYVILYISNRYAYQEELREIARLKKEVQATRYDAITRKSELSEKSRQSHIQDYVQKKNSELKIATKPPFLIE